MYVFIVSGLATIALCVLTLSFSLARNSVNPGFLVGKAAHFHYGDNIADALPYEAVTLKLFNLYTHRAETEEGKETEKRERNIQTGRCFKAMVVCTWTVLQLIECEAYLGVCEVSMCRGQLGKQKRAEEYPLPSTCPPTYPH